MNGPTLWALCFLALSGAAAFGALLMALFVTSGREDRWVEAELIRLQQARLAQSMDVERRRDQ